MSTVDLALDGKVATLLINRADKRNALTQQMWQQLSDHCDTLLHEVKPKLLLLRAAGGKAFSAGADIEELQHNLLDQAWLNHNNQMVQQAQLKLQRLPFSTLAVIEGVCVGGGLGLALCCDFRLATEDARFAITPAKLGLLYSIEDTRRLVKLVGEARAKWLLYTGELQDAATAAEWGLVHQLCAAEQLDPLLAQWQEKLLAVSLISVSGIKQTIAHINDDPVSDEASVRPLFDQAFLQPDFKQAAAAFVSKQRMEFP